MADALGALEEIGRLVADLTAAATAGRAKTLASANAQPFVRAIATAYFGVLRAPIETIQGRRMLVDELDHVIQTMLELASANREKQAYVGLLNELRPLLLEANVLLLKSQSVIQLVLSETENAILDTLAALLPASAASYEQAIRDLREGARVSWRGPASELREALRETIDHLAPDDKVTAAPGFQLEKDQKGPTQKQKVRYILKARRSSSAVIASAEASLATVEEAVATLARTTYARGSVSTHVGSTAKEIKSLKRYVDALLADLLEVA